MTGAGGLQQPPARPPDLRLVPVVLAGWATAGWATGEAADRLITAATSVALLDVVLLLTAAGVVLVGRVRLSGVRLYGVRLGTVRLTRYRGALGVAAIVLAAVTLVLASAGAQQLTRTRTPLTGWAAERAVVQAWGQAIDDAHQVAGGPTGSVRYAVRLNLDQASGRGRTVRLDVPVLVLGDPSWAGLTAGQRLQLTGRLQLAAPGDSVVALLSAHGPPEQVQPGGWPWRLADRLRSGLRRACQGLPAEAGGLLPSLVVGDTSGVTPGLRTDLQVAGLTHLTAVSGANVAITLGSALFLAALIGVRRPLRLALAAVVLVGFVVLARPQPSVLRAAVMGALTLLGTGLSRRPRGVPALAGAAVALLTVDPWLARSAGFALSCLATAGLLLLAPMWSVRWSRSLPRPLATAVAVPAAAQVACGPVVVLLQPSVSLVAVPANLLAEPAVAPATVGGVITAVLAPVWPGGAHAVAWLASLATGWIVTVAHTAAGVPLAGLPWPAGVGGAVLLAVVTALLVWASLRSPPAGAAPGGRVWRPTARGLPTGRRRPGGRRPRPAAIAVVLLAALVLGWWLGPRLPLPGTGGPSWPGSGWEVAQCDVGQGAAMAVRSGPDRAVLVDAGPLPDLIDRCLQRLGVRHLDLILLTHHHADHVDGLTGALHHRDAGQVLISPLPEPAETAGMVRRVAAAARVPVTEGWAGMTGQVGSSPWSVRWRLLTPLDRPHGVGEDPGDEGSVVNESSVASVLDVSAPPGQLRVVGLGDLEVSGQHQLLTQLDRAAGVGDRPVDVLEVAHHGSARQDPALCRRLSPRVALIGVGAGNDYGHPAPSTLTRLRACGATVFRTDLSGDVALAPLLGGGIRVLPDRNG